MTSRLGSLVAHTNVLAYMGKIVMPPFKLCASPQVYGMCYLNISIMADRGFTMNKRHAERVSIALNIPPFLEGRHQLPATEVEQGRKIASLQIHVE